MDALVELLEVVRCAHEVSSVPVDRLGIGYLDPLAVSSSASVGRVGRLEVV